MNDSGTQIFGLFDGMTSVLGMILALALFGTLRGLVLATVTAGVGAASSMAAGQWLADDSQSVHRALLMGLMTLAGSISPAVPFYFTRSWVAYVACFLIVVGLSCRISSLRPEEAPRSYVQTFAVLIIATSLSLGVGALVPGG